MVHPLEITGLIVALLAGAVAIFLAFRLMRNYPLPFVSSYFYYLVFLYIFGVYGLTGSALLESLFMRMDTEQQVVRPEMRLRKLRHRPLLKRESLLRLFREFLVSHS